MDINSRLGRIILVLCAVAAVVGLIANMGR